MSNSETNALVKGADAAYGRQDQDWFNGQTTEALAALYSIARSRPLGAAWDDEVLNALQPRGFFDD